MARANRTSFRPGNAALHKLKDDLRKLPVTLAHDVAQGTAPALTGKAQSDFDSGRTVYDEPRPTGVDGGFLDLYLTGATKRSLRFSASGRIVRAVLSQRYMKYLIGKYRILPNGPLPVSWSRKIDEVFDREKEKVEL